MLVNFNFNINIYSKDVESIHNPVWWPSVIWFKFILFSSVSADLDHPQVSHLCLP